MCDVGAVTRALLTATDPADAATLARRMCQACVTNLDVDGAAISLATAASARDTLWASDPIAELMEDLQFSLGEGICVEAAREGRSVLVPDVAHSELVGRWPVFTAELAGRAQVGALFGLPLRWGATNIGAIDLYRRVPGPLPDTQLDDLLAATDLATTMLLGILTDPDKQDSFEELPSGGRSEIHQAVGMVMIHLHTSAADALARLRAHAYTHRRLLAEVAQDVINGWLRLPPDNT